MKRHLLPVLLALHCGPHHAAVRVPAPRVASPIDAAVGFLLGHERARSFLADELAAFPTLGAQLDAGRARLRASASRGDDLYRRWLSAVLALAAPVTGTAPSYMRTEAWSDLRMNSALVGYAQIRHNYVLLAGQGYDAYGCEIPDGYVEPAVEVYDALLAFARRAHRATPPRGARRTWSRTTAPACGCAPSPARATQRPTTRSRARPRGASWP